MNDANDAQNLVRDIDNFFTQPNLLRNIVILAIAVTVAYLLSKYLARIVIRLAQTVSRHSDSETNEEKHIRLRQIETYLSIAAAAIRATVVIIVGYITWWIITGGKFATSGGLATIGASAFFIVFAGQSLGLIIRDVTAGSIMIAEQWFNIGDHVKIEPFMDAKGVVERFTLRSIKLRSLNGEILWVHNQYIQGVHVTPKGIRTIIVDVFVNDMERGKSTLQQIIDAVPAGKTLLTKPLKIISTEKWNNGLWRISVIGYTAPGREWLIENFFVNAIKDVDKDKNSKDERVFVYEPIARFADPVADKKFLRAVRSPKSNK